MQQSIKSSTSDESALIKQIQATHFPDGHHVVVDVKPVLQVIKAMLLYTTNSMDSVINGAHEQADTSLEDKTIVAGFDGTLAYIIQKVSCELSCKCSGGQDAHTKTMEILNMLSNYSWDAKLVIPLAAIAVSYGELWLLAQLRTTNDLAKSLALLKQLMDITKHASTLKSQFNPIHTLICHMLNVTECIVKFKELPSQYISPETPPMSTAMTHVSAAAYWTIQSVLACASRISSLLGMTYEEHITFSNGAWEFLAHKVDKIRIELGEQLKICNDHIEYQRFMESYQKLRSIIESKHVDTTKILMEFLYKDDLSQLVDGAIKEKISVEVLKSKTVLLLISDFVNFTEELSVLIHFYKGRTKAGFDYQVVWLPIVDRKAPFDDHQFKELQGKMPWYTVHPSLLKPEAEKYIKEEWHFRKKPILVVLDPQGKVVCPNALHMVWIWGNSAYPFTTIREKELWEKETWSLKLLVECIDPTILNLTTAEDTFICMYGGEDIDWIQKFTAEAKAVAQAAGIILKMVYVGKSGTTKINEIFEKEQLWDRGSDHSSIWYFWARLESMLYSKLKHGKIDENDHIMEEVSTMLSFDSSDLGWAMISSGTAEMVKAKVDALWKILAEFDTWGENAKGQNFLAELNKKVLQCKTPHHCIRLILPEIYDGLPEKIECALCGKPMEKYSMYRCCAD